MTEQEALKKKPCSKCKHCQRCEIVDFIYSPCFMQTENNYHPGFEPVNDYEVNEDD